MVLKLVAVITSIFVILSCTTESSYSVAGKDNPPKSGAKLYKKFCQSCHGKNGDAKRANSADLTISTFSVEEIRKVILYGNSEGMMAYKDILRGEQELDSLVVHVQSFRK